MRDRYIYGLVDPRTNEVRYIGQTVDLDRRLKEHISRIPKKITHKNMWLRELMNDNLSPEVAILEVCTRDNVDEREVFWISQYPNLTNVDSGGKSYEGHSNEVRERISKRGEDHPNYGKPMSEEMKARISNTLKGRRPSDNTIAAFTDYARTQGSTWLIHPPEGESFKVFNLNNFCRENNLSNGHMVAVSKGKRKHHKGYTCEKIGV